MKIGVVVGRFQVPDLHAGHHEILSHASGASDTLMVVIGEAAARCTNHDPLDFVTRMLMIQQHYPGSVVVPLRDVANDRVWSKKLDAAINEIAREGDEVTLYCGRDSFKDSYHGKHKIETVQGVRWIRGTNLRISARDQPSQSSLFRHGVIYGVGRKYPTTYMATDIAVVNWNLAGGPMVLVGQRPTETAWRFPGGFVGLDDESLEACAVRELQEEMGLECDVHDMKYVGSFHIDDWRYRNRGDVRVMSTLFTVDSSRVEMPPVLDSDEICKYDWLRLGVGTDTMVPEHGPLMNAISRLEQERRE